MSDTTERAAARPAGTGAAAGTEHFAETGARAQSPWPTGPSGSKRILLVNDMAGYGKVALSAMIPILSHLRHQVFNLPTALVSNTLDYGTFDILETTGYMRNAIAAWDELGFEFDAVATGFLVSQEQARLVADFCRARREAGARVFVDPIMGDDGCLYNGVPASTVDVMREACGAADVIMPNLTEALLLAGRDAKAAEPGAGGLAREDAEALARELHALGPRSVVVTSCLVDGAHVTLVSEAGSLELLPYDEVPVRFPGTGDIFSAVLIGDVLAGRPLAEATRHAMDVVRDLLLLNERNEDRFKGIPVELYLDRIAAGAPAEVARRAQASARGAGASLADTAPREGAARHGA